MNKVQIAHEWLKNNLTAEEFSQLHIKMAADMCNLGLYSQIAVEMQQAIEKLRNKNAKSD